MKDKKTENELNPHKNVYKSVNNALQSVQALLRNTSEAISDIIRKMDGIEDDEMLLSHIQDEMVVATAMLLSHAFQLKAASYMAWCYLGLSVGVVQDGFTASSGIPQLLDMQNNLMNEELTPLEIRSSATVLQDIEESMSADATHIINMSEEALQAILKSFIQEEK